MKKCKFRLGYANCLVVDCVGSNGGLAMLRKKDLNISLLNYSKSHIDAMMIDDTNSKKKWFLMGIYGHLDSTKRSDT